MTISAIQQHSFAHRNRICVFEIICLERQRICVIAEQPPDIHEETVYNWMNNVMSIINSKHHESVFIICAMAPGSIPRHPDGGVDIFEVRARLLRHGYLFMLNSHKLRGPSGTKCFLPKISETFIMLH